MKRKEKEWRESDGIGVTRRRGGVGRQSGNKWERKRWMLRESDGEEVRVREFELNPSRRDVESFSLSSARVRGSRRYLTQLRPSERNRKTGLVTVPGSYVEFKIPAGAKKSMGGVIATNRAYLKNETTKVLSHATPILLSSTFSIGYSSLIELETIRWRMYAAFWNVSTKIRMEGRKKKKVKDRWSENGTIFTSRCDRIGSILVGKIVTADDFPIHYALTSITSNIRWCALFHARKIHLCKVEMRFFTPPLFTILILENFNFCVARRN